jgi:hypothetical protein
LLSLEGEDRIGEGCDVFEQVLAGEGDWALVDVGDEDIAQFGGDLVVLLVVVRAHILHHPRSRAPEFRVGYLHGEAVRAPGEVGIEDQHQVAGWGFILHMRHRFLKAKFLAEEPAHAKDGVGTDSAIGLNRQ